jgi:hypothetical protein
MTGWLSTSINPSLTFGALIGAANVRERSSSDARFLAVIVVVGPTTAVLPPVLSAHVDSIGKFVAGILRDRSGIRLQRRERCILN